MNKIAKVIVATKPPTAYSYSFPKTALWAQVIEAPEVKRIKVFKSGTPYGLKTDKPTGGHSAPTQIEGTKLE
jgi:hypothetical protein